MISIIVPIYNSEQTLGRCFESILSQTYQNFELILVNDGSTDSSEAICLYYVKKYGNKIKYYSKENGGVSSARNLGIMHAKGDLLCFVDSDDYVDNTYLEVLYNSLINYNSDFSMCDICNNNSDGQDETIELLDNNEIVSAIISKQYSNLNGGPYCKLFLADLVDGLRFNENIFLGEDTLFCIEYAKRCKKGIYVRQGLYHYDTPNTSISYRNDVQMLKKYLTYIDSRCEMLKDTSMLNRHTYTLIVNSLLESVQESYFVAKKYGEKSIQNSLCSLMRVFLNDYKLSFKETTKPISWYIMANRTRWFDKWMYLYGKYHGLLYKFKSQ